MQSLMLLFVNRYYARVTNLLLVPNVALKPEDLLADWTQPVSWGLGLFCDIGRRMKQPDVNQQVLRLSAFLPVIPLKLEQTWECLSWPTGGTTAFDAEDQDSQNTVVS